MTEVEGELVTPTGAAIVAAVKTKDKLPETFEIQRIGIGAGNHILIFFFDRIIWNLF